MSFCQNVVSSTEQVIEIIGREVSEKNKFIFHGMRFKKLFDIILYLWLLAILNQTVPWRLKLSLTEAPSPESEFSSFDIFPSWQSLVWSFHKQSFCPACSFWRLKIWKKMIKWFYHLGCWPFSEQIHTQRTQWGRALRREDWEKRKEEQWTWYSTQHPMTYIYITFILNIIRWKGK